MAVWFSHMPITHLVKKEITEPTFPRGPNEQVRVRQTSGQQVLGHSAFVNARHIQFALRNKAGDTARASCAHVYMNACMVKV